MKLEKNSSSIATRLITQILGIYFLFAILATLSQLYVEFEGEKKQLKNEIRSIMSTFNPIFVQSLWSLNNPQLESNVKGVMRNPKVVGVKILDEAGELVMAVGTIHNQGSQLVEADSIHQTFSAFHPKIRWQEFYEFQSNLTYTSKSRGDIRIGTLYLYANSDPIISELSSTFAITVISAVLKTIFLWIIAIIIIRRNVSIPLNLISSAMEKFIPKKHKVQEDDLLKIQHGQDELNNLMATFVTMKVALGNKEKEVMNYQQGLEEAKEALEEKVKERTLELEALNLKLLEASTTDQLTGLRNRRYFDEHATNQYMFCMRHDKPLSLILIDIDHFKDINDTYGHDIGDACLRNVANVLKKNINRSGDIVARFGGEEFIILLPDTAESEANTVAEKVRVSIENSLFYANSKLVPITASLGISTFHPHLSTPLTELIKFADLALYQSKQNGRNQTTEYQDKAS